ncbi:MAG: hypothetical protein AB1330_11155 [Bacillota bacterium]
MGRKWFVALALWLFCVGWGVGHCLAALNHTLGPEKEVQALALHRLSPQSYRVELLDLAFTFDLPEEPQVLAARLREEARARLERLGDFLRVEP